MSEGVEADRRAQSYDTAKYDVWALPRLVLLHWVLNPGLVFNEVVLGQRVPRAMLVERQSPQPLSDRFLVPCPHCAAVHPGRLWGGWNAFCHWLGYVCPGCGGFIPGLWNVFSLLLLAALLPLWIVPLLLFRERWRQYEFRRVRRALASLPSHARRTAWVRTGVLGWGGTMWLLLGVLPQVWALLHGGEPDWEEAAVQLPMWLLAGWFWGMWMKRWMNKPGTARKVPGG